MIIYGSKAVHLLTVPSKTATYPDVAYGISRMELKDMYDSGEIFNINR
jgi:hypothetical protein